MKAKPSFKDWILVTRPWSFSVSALPALVAMLYVIHTNDDYNWPFALCAIIGTVIFHAGANLLSDYNDFRRGVDRPGKQGGTDALTSGCFRAKQILTYSLILLTLGVLMGLWLVWQTGVQLLYIGLIGTTGALFYSFFKYRALGDLIIFLVYGPVIMLGTGFVMLGRMEWILLLVSLPMTFITVNVLHSNNTRDQQSDRSAEIATLAMKMGTRFSVWHYYVLTAAAYLSLLLMVAFGLLPALCLITLLTLPIAYKNCMLMRQALRDISSIGNLDLATAQLQTAFSLLMSLSLILSIVL